MQVTETTDASQNARAERMRTALGRIKAWLRSNKAEDIVANLAPPTSDEEIASCAKVLGFAIPDDLRWRRACAKISCRCSVMRPTTSSR